MAKAEPEEIFEYIKSCTYPNNKAKHLSGMSRMLISEFGGKVPSDTDFLQRLPGVGRKSANVVASVVFKKPVMAVDTHVFRVSNRIGLVKNAKHHLVSKNSLCRIYLLINSSGASLAYSSWTIYLQSKESSLRQVWT
jgi:endonuclease-3